MTMYKLKNVLHDIQEYFQYFQFVGNFQE